MRQQAPPAQAGGEGPSPGLPGSAITPAAALLGRLAGTPATAASDPPTAGTGAAVALADGQFLPTPAPIPLGLAAAVQPGSAAGVPGDAAAAAGGAEAPAAEPSQPAARLTGFKRKAGSAPADQPEEVPGGDSASMAVDDVAAVAAPPDTAAPMDADAPAECDAPISASSADPAAPPAPAAEAPDSAACCGAAAQLPTPMAAQAPARGALPLGVADVPTPVVAAFAAADQLLYHQPRPRSCPPLFK